MHSVYRWSQNDVNPEHLSELEAHDLGAFNSRSELWFFELKNFLIWMSRSSCIFPLVQLPSYLCPYLGINSFGHASRSCASVGAH